MSDFVKIKGYDVRLDVVYDSDSHMWVKQISNGNVRIGMDPLGVEINGTLAQVALLELGTELKKGDPMGTMEAEKFVGPFTSPLSGKVVANNLELSANPALIDQDPYDKGWLVELEPNNFEEELPSLVSGEDQIKKWFEGKVQEYKIKGVLAE